MLYEDVDTCETLRKIVFGLCPDGIAKEDLMQEALIWLWRMEEEQPGQTRSWYLQSCAFHLHKHLATGRSLDSHKHRKGKLFSIEDQQEIPADQWERAISVPPEITDPELFVALEQLLTPPEQATLGYLAEGWGAREIARRMGVSHQAIVKRRQRIATLASQLGLEGSLERRTAL